LLQWGFWTFRDNLLFGTGNGSWIYSVFNYNVEGVIPYDDKLNVFRHLAHNKFSLVAAEQGLVGFMLFFIWIFWQVVIYLKHTIQSKIDNSGIYFYSVLIYLLLSCFYATMNSTPNFVSMAEILFYINMGFLYRINIQKTFC
jgi:O-antigen ligase